MCEPSHYILRTDRDECLGYGLIECLPRSLSSLPHQVLYLREGLFYGVEVRRVRWQEHQVAAPNFDELPHPFRPVRPQPIEHHHLSFDEARCQSLLHVSLEDLFVGSPLYAHALAHPSFQSDGGDQGLVLALRFLGTLPYALLPLGALALSRSIEIEKPLSSMNTTLLASKREASHFHRARSSSSRSCAMGDFF